MTGITRYKTGSTPSTPPAGYTVLFADSVDNNIKQLDSNGDVTDLASSGGGGGTATFAVSGVNQNGGFVVTEEGVGNDSIRISAGQISLVELGQETLVTLSNDFIISQADGLPSTGAHKVIALKYVAGDESFVSTGDVSLFVAPGNECTIATVRLTINILGRGTFDIGGATTQDYRKGIELTKAFYLSSGTNLAISGRPWSVFDQIDANISTNRGNASSDFGCEFYNDGGVIKYRTTRDAIVLRRAVAPIGGDAVEQYATEDIFLGMWRDKAKTTRGTAVRGMVRGLIDSLGEVDYVSNTAFLSGGIYEDYWNYIDTTDDNAPSTSAAWTLKSANKWSIMALLAFGGSGNVIMVLGKAEYDTADIDTAEDSIYTLDINSRTEDCSIVGMFLVKQAATLTTADIKKLPSPKSILSQ